MKKPRLKFPARIRCEPEPARDTGPSLGRPAKYAGETQSERDRIRRACFRHGKNPDELDVSKLGRRGRPSKWRGETRQEKDKNRKAFKRLLAAGIDEALLRAEYMEKEQ